MFNDSINFLVQSIEKPPLVNYDGILYQKYTNFFDDFLLKKIDANTGIFPFDRLDTQEHKERKNFSSKEPIVKELTILFMHRRITSALEDVYQTVFKFSSCDIWLDDAGYWLAPHLDDTRIKLGLQIYCSKESNSGTTLFSKDVESIVEHFAWKEEYRKYEVDTVKFEHNSGYSLLNNTVSWHGVYPLVSNNRKSVYIRYS
jgi:hypothetical protein